MEVKRQTDGKGMEYSVKKLQPHKYEVYEKNTKNRKQCIKLVMERFFQRDG